MSSSTSQISSSPLALARSASNSIVSSTNSRNSSGGLNLQWDHVNLKDGVITLYPGETKNDDGRIIPITDDMRIVLKRTRLTAWVFHRDGRKIRDFRKSWDIAAKNAGTPDLLFHDLRRSAVRNMVRGGVPEAIAMKISGHKTRAVFERYNIVDDKDIGEAGKMIGRYLKAKKGA
jgi:integrase